MVCVSLLLTLRLCVMSSCEGKAYQVGQPCSALALAIAESCTKCCKQTNIQKGSHSQLESLISELPSFLTKKPKKPNRTFIFFHSSKFNWALKWLKITLTSISIEMDSHRTTFSRPAAVKLAAVTGWRTVVYTSAFFLPLWRWLLICLGYDLQISCMLKGWSCSGLGWEVRELVWRSSVLYWY